ncbi:MAG: hypothetical protein E7543_07680 [Ruminococcaceae bacterium]|nr:hypothetical protein [Oscillospiraceae bacterium]
MAEIDTEYLNKNEPFRLVKLIGGDFAMIDTPAIVGYCHNEEHKGIVTVTIMQEHDCISKGCHYFERFEDYPYWKKYNNREEQKKFLKLKQQRKNEKLKAREEVLRKRDEKFIARAYEIAEKIGLNNIKIISVSKNGKEYTLFYISDKPINDWFDFREIAFIMNREFKKKFILKHIKNTDGSYATL